MEEEDTRKKRWRRRGRRTNVRREGEEEQNEEEDEDEDDSGDGRDPEVSTGAGGSVGKPVQRGAGKAALEADKESNGGTIHESPQQNTEPPEPKPGIRLTAALRSRGRSRRP